MSFRSLKRSNIVAAMIAAFAASLTLTTLAALPEARADDGRGRGGKAAAKWLSGDFHQHTFYTDGSTAFDFAMRQSDAFGLDWWANSEHGGERNRNGEGVFWDALIPSPAILGAFELSGGHREMWRWQSLRGFAFADVVRNRGLYPDKRIFSGLEWNVPGHEHCSTAVVAKDASAISAFEYQFDNSDDDFLPDVMSDPAMEPYGTLTKQNGKLTFSQAATAVVTTSKSFPERHRDAVKGCAWMQDAYDRGLIDNAWIVFAHVERDGAWTADGGGGYNVEHFRDFNNAAPDVCFGFEGAPGHQVNSDRGFGNPVTCDAAGVCTSDDFGGSYGGAGIYTAKVGGLWDALLGEGRRWFNFASSDYHLHYTAGGDDFYPGEYQRTWVKAVDADRDGSHSLSEIADGLRSGNAWSVQGDLVDFLEFEAQSRNQKAEIGGELKALKPINNLKLTIRFKSPAANNCKPDGDFITSCAAPLVDHIDLIAGEIGGKLDPASPEYANPANASAKVIASFTAKDWETDRDGYSVVVHHLRDVGRSMYFRLRGTNLACGTPYETGEAARLPSAEHCNPLADALVTRNLGVDAAQEAWNDLWFYSNPIFVYVKR